MLQTIFYNCCLSELNNYQASSKHWLTGPFGVVGMEVLHELSGQKKTILQSEIDHNYARPWHIRINSQQKYPTRLTKFLFLKNFPRHFLSKYPHAFLARHDGQIDVGSAEDLCDSSFVGSVEVEEGELPDLAVDTSLWTQQMDRLYYKTLQILQQHYLTTIVCDKLPNNSIKMANLMEDTALQLRHSFASIAGWDNELLIWLNDLFQSKSPTHEHLISIYHEALQYLSLKIPSLINKFYKPPTPASMPSKILLDPFDEDLPPLKRLPCNPIILLVPNGPSKTPSSRMEYWKTLLSSLGQLINVNIPYKPDQNAPELLQMIKLSVRDKIRDLRKKKSNETRPLVLVGFNQGSLIAIHAALESPGQAMAIVCLGFPMLSVNGYRGDLDDPILDITTPVLFVVGQMASNLTLDGIERLRESMGRSDTGLVLVGGSNDKLIIRIGKKLHDNITQAMVDRCIADEIYEFVDSLQPKSEG